MEHLNELFIEAGTLMLAGMVFVFAFLGLSLVGWLIILIALISRFFIGGKGFFKQKRVGQHGMLFTIYKIETINPKGLIKESSKISTLGKYLRQSKIDELPQLWHVLTGDLSLVGPRPPIPIEVAEYSAWDRKRLEVTPGLTCTWQVSGRSDIDFETQVNLDIDYIKRRSFIMDLVLLLRTVPAVLSGKGAY